MVKRPQVTSSDNNALFAAIATRYDLLNHLLSLNIDRRWRKKLVKSAGAKRGDKILDLCTGTGDVALRFARNNQMGEIVGVDLAEEMLRLARRKMLNKGSTKRIAILRGDAVNLPFDDDHFNVVTVAFGLRNIRLHRQGISEMVRVLKKNGRLLILEFSPPRSNLFGAVYRLCLKTVIPAVGGIMSGSTKAYRYLSASIAGFPEPERIKDLMEEAGLKNVQFKQMTGGIAYIHRGEK